MFRVFGHSSVSVLDGGMRGWMADGGPLTAESSRPEPTDFRATLNRSWVKTYEEILENIRTKRVQVVDSRAAGRFRGTEPEPRDELLQTSIMSVQTPALVSTQWLINAVKTNQVGPKLRILDATWFLPIMKRDAQAEFAQQHIPGASYFDIDACSDRSSGLDLMFMLPEPSSFSRYVSERGISNDTHVVVYDFDSFTAYRVWWMFRVFGHSSVSVLDGGMRGWMADGGPLTAESSRPERTDFRATLNRSWVKTYEEILENIRTKRVQVVDSRTEGQFKGTEPELRPGVLPGHFPGTINMSFISFLDDSGKLHGAERLSEMFQEAGVDLQKPLWVTCSYGITACLVALTAHLLGHPGVCIYDGSWSEFFAKASPEYIISEGEAKKD
ncbi:thiosulfate sulfurtransferase-like isoform X2 [Acanthochromis polyacanthus]|uniref:thiosulfate sulfurtransferase-like isoform X2 n=1 Tax=Acanthochromis polyacanthus TaxID=80966 RepID=UPI0022340CBD|nr:thiosulfate sulfurtransferase-like isoform X2 [Acanthochromis polyacanthus]XP_051795029.1 thiosulfate sulfurtransferase-like isoform X2 [Acanthochromis polyacanthus]